MTERTYLEVRGPIRQDDLHCVVFSEKYIVVVQEVELESVEALIFEGSCQVVLGGHLIPLVPISLPASADGEPWLVFESDPVVLPERICRAYVADVVMEIHALDVPRVLRTDALQAVVALP